MMKTPSKFVLFHKVIALSLIGGVLFTIVLAPLKTFAQGQEINPTGPLPETNTQAEPTNALFEVTDKQAKASQGTTESAEAKKQPVTELAVEGVTCSAAAILGAVLTSAISAALTEMIGGIVQEKIKQEVQGVPKNPVPVEELKELLATQKRNLDYQKLNTHAEKGVPGPFGTYINVSWDSIAWCVVNAMIEYIANATIAWANSGFNGNPAFLENPERFFSDLADYQAGTIVRDIAYGASGGKVNVCQPFRISIAIGLAQGYSGYGQNATDAKYRGMSCRLSDITQEKLFQGVSVGTKGSTVGSSALTWSEWNAVTQHDSNNQYGAYILANRAVYAAVDAKKNELEFEIGINNGWLNFKKCPEGEKDPAKCNTVTPGRLIESQLNSTLDASKHRLVMATKFDQMITAIVNNLIKVALNKILEETKK